MLFSIFKFCLFLAAHAVVSFLAIYASDVEESEKERELSMTLDMPQLNDIFCRIHDREIGFDDFFSYVNNDIIQSDRYFVLRSSLKKLRKENYMIFVGLLPSTVFLMRAKSAMTKLGGPGGTVLCIVFTIALFAAVYFAVSKIYNHTLKLPQFNTNAKNNRTMLEDHYRYLLRFETTIRRRNMVQKVFAVVYFLCFWSPGGYYA